MGEMAEGLERPVVLEESKGWFKRGRIRVIIINEDMSYSEYYRKYPKSYTIEIKEKAYFVVAKCIIRGKYPMLIYFFNNPFPLYLEFRASKLKATDLHSEEQIRGMPEKELVTLSNIYLDAESVYLALNTRFLRGLYEKPGLTLKAWLLIMGAVVLVLLIVLQLTGKVDVMSWFAGGR